MIFWSETMSDSYRLYKMMWPFLGPDGVSAARVQKLHHHGDETAGKNEEPSEFCLNKRSSDAPRCCTSSITTEASKERKGPYGECSSCFIVILCEKNCGETQT